MLVVLGLSFWGSYVYFSSLKPKTAVSEVVPVVSSTPVPLPYRFDAAPTSSLKASVLSKSGEVQYVSRVATEAAVLTVGTLQQGEDILTGKDGRVEIQFTSSESARLSPLSQVNIIQALPEKIVLEHVAGTADYISEATMLSVRTKRMLVTLSQAEMSLSYNDVTDMVTMNVKKGQVSVGYNDAKFLSHVETISAGHFATFNNPKRKLVIQ